MTDIDAIFTDRKRRANRRTRSRFAEELRQDAVQLVDRLSRSGSRNPYMS